MAAFCTPVATAAWLAAPISTESVAGIPVTSTAPVTPASVEAPDLAVQGEAAAPAAPVSVPVATPPTTASASATSSAPAAAVTTAPAASAPATSQVSTTAPSTAAASTTKPSTTKPSAAASTTKPTAAPSTTKPSTTKPSTTKPATTKPATTKPAAATSTTTTRQAAAPASTASVAAAPATTGGDVQAQAVTANAPVFQGAAAAPRNQGAAKQGTSAPVPQVAPVTTGQVTPRPDLAASVLALTNAERAKAGLAPVTANSCITGKVAQPFAQTLATKKSTYHNDLMLIINACGGRTAGENVASGYATPEAVVAAWMNSAGHRANVLNASYKTLGVGIAQAADGTYFWVQNFNG